jgi:hypothetical protein
MFFSSLRALPAKNLGKQLMQWQHRPPYMKSLLIGAGIVVLIVLGIFLFIDSPDGFEFLRQYRSLLLYAAVPIISYFFSRVITTTRTRAYLLHENGVYILYGKPENKQSAGNWAPWHDFTRAELRDDGVKVFPKNQLQQSVYFYCASNRLNVYSIISSQVAQHRYIVFDKEKKQALQK